MCPRVLLTGHVTMDEEEPEDLGEIRSVLLSKVCENSCFPGVFFLFPKRLKRCEVSDRFLGCGPSSSLQSALSAARGGWAARIRPSSRLQELPLPLSMCSAPTQDRRDASHQHTCLRAWIPERAFLTPEVRSQVSVHWHLALRPNAKFRSTKLAVSL